MALDIAANRTTVLDESLDSGRISPDGTHIAHFTRPIPSADCAAPFDAAGSLERPRNSLPRAS